MEDKKNVYNHDIKCNVKSCKNINEDNTKCTLKEIKISCDCDPCDCDNCDLTTCKSFETKTDE